MPRTYAPHVVARSQSCKLIQSSRSQVLTNFVLCINFGSNGQLLRLLVGLLIALLDLTLQQQTQPFRKRSDDALNCVVQLMLVLFFVLGIVVKLCDTDESCSSVVGIDSAYTVSLLIFFVGLFGVLAPIGMVAQKLFFARPVPILRDARTMEPPKLLLSEGERYHLFLCPTDTTEPTSSHSHMPNAHIPVCLQEPHLEHRARPVRRHQAPITAVAAWRYRVP